MSNSVGPYYWPQRRQGQPAGRVARLCRCSGVSDPAGSVQQRVRQCIGLESTSTTSGGSTSASFTAYENCLKSHGVNFSGLGFRLGGGFGRALGRRQRRDRRSRRPRGLSCRRRRLHARASDPNSTGEGDGERLRCLPQLSEAPWRHSSDRAGLRRFWSWRELDVYHHEPEAAGCDGGLRRLATQGRLRRRVPRGLDEHDELKTEVSAVSPDCPRSSTPDRHRGRLFRFRASSSKHIRPLQASPGNKFQHLTNTEKRSEPHVISTQPQNRIRAGAYLALTAGAAVVLTSGCSRSSTPRRLRARWRGRSLSRSARSRRACRHQATSALPSPSRSTSQTGGTLTAVDVAVGDKVKAGTGDRKDRPDRRRRRAAVRPGQPAGGRDGARRGRSRRDLRPARAEPGEHVVFPAPADDRRASS